MKRLSAVLITGLIVLPGYAEPQPPAWDEFCPSKYLTATYKEPGLFTTRWRRDKNYWAKRRGQFNNSLKLCEESSSDKAMCYLKVRQAEQQRTDQWETKKAQTKALRNL